MEKDKIKEELIKKIVDILSNINDLWVLNQIYRFAVNITKK